jgi:probable rRNA maturation factor
MPEPLSDSRLETVSDSRPDSLPDCLDAGTLALPSLFLTIYADPELEALYPDWDVRRQRLEDRLRALWPLFLTIAGEEGVFDKLGVDPARHTLEIELSWVANARMRQLNRDYRHKDAPTDVLTFTLLADSSHAAVWLHLPVLQPGSIFVSVPWAEEAIPPDEPRRARAVERYLMERVVHGLLHLHGFHHDTMPDYERVVAIQNRVLTLVFAENAGMSGLS